MSARPVPRLSFDEYLGVERQAAGRSEFQAGELLALAGASEAHNVIAGNVFALLHAALRGGSCRVYSSDMKIWMPRVARAVYPDVSVVCGPRRFHDDVQDAILNPVVVIEVLSPSTEAYDRGAKFEAYRTVDTIREYVLVSQASQKIERFTREAGSTQWAFEALPEEETALRLRCVPVDLPIAQIYEGVEGIPTRSAPA